MQKAANPNFSALTMAKGSRARLYPLVGANLYPITELTCDRTSAAVTEVLDLGWVVHEFWVDQNEDQCILFTRH